jgi:hypothetical protein
MKATLVLAIALGMFGCDAAPKVDDTPNQASQAGTYPAGPYGYVQGSVIENIKFLGKVDPTGSSAYDGLPMKDLSMADYHGDSTVKYVVLSGVAGWCAPCNDEQKQVPAMQAMYEPKGFRFFEALIQGYNARTGAPATEADLNAWAKKHSLPVGLGLDPEDKIHQYADIGAFPLNMVVRTSDMQIVHMQVGEEMLDPILSALP